jgi:hypothetical protein
MTEEIRHPAQVHVVRGTPDDVELAALVAGLAAVAVDDDTPDADAPRSAWADRARGLQGTPSVPLPGPDAWRWSLRG